MPFAARTYIPGPVPTRGYFWEAGLNENFGSPAEAREYLRQLLVHNHEIIEPAIFNIAAVWGNSGKKVVELFGYGDFLHLAWPGNPEVYSWVFENGVYKPKERNVACAETMMVLGMEEDHRRTTHSLDEYMKTPPHLGELEPALYL